MSFTNYLAAKMLDHLFTDAAYSPPATLYVALLTAAANLETGSVTEATGTGYARVATTAAEWGAATVADPSVKSNTTAITFPQAGGDWSSGVNMTHFAIYDADPAGNLLVGGTLTTPKPVLNGDTASFGIGQLSLTLD